MTAGPAPLKAGGPSNLLTQIGSSAAAGAARGTMSHAALTGAAPTICGLVSPIPGSIERSLS
ncbi:hypothetical protein SAMN06295912_12136 [Sphingomonas laterariae]|uniref:Uncharacterized protein n=1 Tax=Edaphosphingomonas laterariae TaxID=861865 RepID=A0A239I3Y6_9SPHN|nr:hypothetical protein SAMN06295912_12136 [Sphingomonas laterariae]